MQGMTLKLKRGMFALAFTLVSLFCVQRLMISYPSLGMSVLVGGVSAVVGMLLANSIFRK